MAQILLQIAGGALGCAAGLLIGFIFWGKK